MFCRNCGEVILDTDVTCPKCGYAAGTGTNYCPHCASPTDPTTTECEICGNPVGNGQPAGAAGYQQTYAPPQSNTSGAYSTDQFQQQGSAFAGQYQNGYAQQNQGYGGYDNGYAQQSQNGYGNGYGGGYDNGYAQQSQNGYGNGYGGYDNGYAQQSQNGYGNGYGGYDDGYAQQSQNGYSNGYGGQQTQYQDPYAANPGSSAFRQDPNQGVFGQNTTFVPPNTTGAYGTRSNPSYYQNVTYKSKVSAGVLGILLGWLGIHNFYLGYTSKAVAQLVLTVCGCGFPIALIWGIVEGLMILTGAIDHDANGNKLKD